jgi:hypothetical protein
VLMLCAIICSVLDQTEPDNLIIQEPLAFEIAKHSFDRLNERNKIFWLEDTIQIALASVWLSYICKYKYINSSSLSKENSYILEIDISSLKFKSKPESHGASGSKSPGVN